MTAKRFAYAKNKSGKIVAEFFRPAVSVDPISESLRLLTFLLDDNNAHVGGFFGGSFGYGVDFENDVFMMHPFCWCDKEDCLWCGAGCEMKWSEPKHSNGCYQRRLNKLRRKYGKKEPWGWTVDVFCKGYEKEKRDLCETMEVDFDFGNEVHCTCGAQEEREKAYESCQCDWHMGRGRFRFGAAVEAPNFWFKKSSGFRIEWYKYIGRGMHLEREISGQEWLEMLTACVESLGRNLDDVIPEYMEAVEKASTIEAAEMEQILGNL